MDEHEVAELKARIERRKELTLEERQVEAIEEISDSLIGLLSALNRIGDNI